MLQRPKISIIGAGGNVGSAVFQYCVPKELGDFVLIDLKEKVAQGKAFDIYQSSSYASNFNCQFIATDDMAHMQNSDIVVVTAGMPRKPGQSREDLVAINAKIIKEICENIKKYAPESILIIVSNPLDAMLTVAQHVSQFPRERVIGMSGVLDSSRFRTNIAKHLNVHVNDVCAIVLGAHTDKDMVPIVSTATVGGMPLTKLLTPKEIEDIVERTKRGGAELTELIGTSAWIAPGAGVSAMLSSIVLNQGRILPCSVKLQGEFGIDDACLCVPVQLNNQGAAKIFDFTLSSSELEAFHCAHQAYLKVKELALANV